MTKNVEFRIEGECHICTSHARTPDGYPVRRRPGIGTLTYISHLIYEEHHGEIPDGLVVRHTCDNPPCINPDHLIIGTQAQNIQDMIDRGRKPMKLTETDVLAIIESKEKPKILAVRYRIGLPHVYKIKRGEGRKSLSQRSTKMT